MQKAFQLSKLDMPTRPASAARTSSVGSSGLSRPSSAPTSKSSGGSSSSSATLVRAASARNLKVINQELQAIYEAVGVTEKMLKKTRSAPGLPMKITAVEKSPWSRGAPRESGSLHLIERKRLELAAMAPQPQITWSASKPPPAWASPPALSTGGASHRHPPRFPDPKPAIEVEGLWTLESMAAEWQKKAAGAFWGKAPRESGSLALIEKRRLELAARAPSGRSHIQWPAASVPRRRRPPALSSSASASEFNILTSRPQLWRPLDVSSRKHTTPEDLLQLAKDPTPLREAGRPVPKLVARCSSSSSSSAQDREDGGGGEKEQIFQTLAIDLSRNLLTSIASLPSVLTRVVVDASALKTIDLSFNRISGLPKALGALRSLEGLKLHSNALARIEELVHLHPLVALARLTLQHNPLAMQRLTELQRLLIKQASGLEAESEFLPEAYRLKVLGRLPQLRLLDGMAVTNQERIRAMMLASEKLASRGEAAEERGVPRSRPHPKDAAAMAKFHDQKSEQKSDA